MPIRSAGSQWLKEHYHLSGFVITHSSYIGSNESIELTSKGTVEQVYGMKYAPSGSTPLLHLEFSLKYDDLNLDFLKTVFKNIPPEDIVTFIESSPSGKYTRKIGFLYEFLTGQLLPIKRPTSGNYTDLLDAKKYVTGKTVKNARWRVNNNLLGTPSFCPIVRRTKLLSELLSQNIRKKIEQLEESFPPDIFRRAVNYLYHKETRSSYEIEKERPSADRIERFIYLLGIAGTEQTTPLLDEKCLVKLQNTIVDPRFAAKSFRNFQNYIGQTLPNYQDIIHYICPPPAFLTSLMEGLKESAHKIDEVNAEIKAAIIAFSFVFIHPFEDGNGRLHRFIIHDVLVRDGLVPHGLIIPVSAYMLNHIRDYDHVLEKYSTPLMQRIKYEKTEAGEIKVTNEKEVEGYFRYPDLTDHCIYLSQIIHAILDEDMPNELKFIQRHDEIKKAIQNIVDMPDKDIDLMILFLYQNKGIFPKRRREKFSKLTDEEVDEMQKKFRDIFEMNQ
ncbi:MAG: Fic family protein [Mangrovibacterium sp.]